MAYRDSSTSAEDNKSSGWILLIVGVAGLIFVVLGMTGVIPIKFTNPYLFYGVLIAIFLLFTVMGVVSMFNAKKFESSAKNEKSIKQSLIEWSLENLSAEDIDNKANLNGFSLEEMPIEEKYFRRAAVIRVLLNAQFINLDQGLLDSVIDNDIYDKVFGEDESCELP